MGLLIGISGKIGTGKSKLANLLMERFPGAERMSFAGALKRETSKVFGFPTAWCYTGKDIPLDFSRPSPDASSASYSPPGAKSVSHPSGRLTLRLEGFWTVRELMQFWGTDICRTHDPDYWVKRMESATEDARTYGRSVIIDDVRFPNELDMVRRLGGLTVRLDPYEGWRPGPYADHPSETALDDETCWDVRAQPAFGALDDVAELVAFVSDNRRRREVA